MIQITKEHMEAAKSRRGGWGLKQLKLILPDNAFLKRGNGKGTLNLRKGWKKRIIGAKISNCRLWKFIEMKNWHLDRGYGSWWT